MNILVVDDSTFMRRAICSIAVECGYKPLEAGNGVECLVQLRKHERYIALIVLDWNMPVMDGYEVLTKIRSEKRFNRIPIIMATADGVAGDVAKAIKAGADSYLIKPFTSKSLSEKIHELLAKQPAPSE